MFIKSFTFSDGNKIEIWSLQKRKKETFIVSLFTICESTELCSLSNAYWLCLGLNGISTISS